MKFWLSSAALGWALCADGAEWSVLPPFDQRQPKPPKTANGAKPIQPGDPWPTDQKFRWLIGELKIPEIIGKESAAGRAIGLQIDCGDGGEVWVDDQLQVRFDNDHPALALLATEATPGQAVRVAVQVYGKVQGGDRFSQANWVLINKERVHDRLAITIRPDQVTGSVPAGLVGLSQGGGLADYEEATARKLEEGGFKWFRMDNVLTGALKKDKEGALVYDWKDFDKRVDFMARMGAEPILCVSYMPQVLDAVPNHERQSAPKDYAAWEELCFEAAQHSRKRGRRIPFWEVWNEVNTGWLKPGPDDTGSDAFKKLYAEAIGKEQTNLTVIRRFEAYCKLYRATVRGVLRADPQAKIGGPALASGPMENSKDCGHCAHGQGFARGLMLWCRQEKLPLDFVSWHEYFQPPEKIAKEASVFRAYLAEFPDLQKSAQHLMITEWNEAWWADRPQDHEVGAAWCANSITRAFLPAKIDRPCFFYAKQGDMNFRGDYSLLLQNNTPKAAYNVAKVFNGLSGEWVGVEGGDGDVSVVAAWDAARARLAVVLVNFRDRYALRRPIRLNIGRLPTGLAGASWQEWIIDATHSNAWHDLRKAELTKTQEGKITGNEFVFEQTLMANSVTLIELIGK